LYLERLFTFGWEREMRKLRFYCSEWEPLQRLETILTIVFAQSIPHCTMNGLTTGYSSKGVFDVGNEELAHDAVDPAIFTQACDNR
jgi:hypothetical protein